MADYFRFFSGYTECPGYSVYCSHPYDDYKLFLGLPPVRIWFVPVLKRYTYLEWVYTFIQCYPVDQLCNYIRIDGILFELIYKISRVMVPKSNNYTFCSFLREKTR